MTRDARLLIATVVLATAAITLLVQAWIVALFVDGAVMGDWSYFSKTFGVTPPAPACLDWCAPEMPFLAGWIGISLFACGLLTVILTWWKPKR